MHKLKPNLKYKCISNIFHLLSAPDSVLYAKPVLASLVVESKCIHKFFSSAISNFIVDLHVYPSRAITRRFVCSLVCLGQNTGTVAILAATNNRKIESHTKRTTGKTMMQISLLWAPC